jgi:hypothetical protein
MWESIKIIEYELPMPMHSDRRKFIEQEVQKIKRSIQKVIGQME